MKMGVRYEGRLVMRRPTPQSAAVLTVTACLSLIAFSPQEIPTRRLLTASAEFPHAFSQVGGARELADGRLVVLDGIEAHVMLVDFSRGTYRLLGRRGAGPREYEVPGQLLSLSGGRVGVRDDGNGARVLVVERDGTPGAFVDYSAAQVSEGRTPRPRFVPAASDTLGGFHTPVPAVRFRDNGNSELADSSAIERFDLATHRRDTVAWVDARLGTVRRISRDGRSVIAPPSIALRPFLAADQWAVSEDGVVAVVSTTPYRVTFFDRRARLDGPEIRYDPIPVTQRDKDAWLERLRSPGRMLVASRNGDSRSVVTKGRVPGAGRRVEWPRYFPPFLDPPLFASDGRLWIRRTGSTGADQIYDIVDRRGALVQRAILPSRSRVVAVSERAVYAAFETDEGLQLLRQYAWP
jgi:hypothetical protein